MSNEQWLRRPVAWIMSTELVTVSAETRVAEAIGAVLEASIGGIPVVDEDNVLVGMVTKSALLGASRSGHPWTTTVAQIMTPVVSMLPKNASLANAAAVMAMDSTHRVAVVDEEGHLLGVVTSLDLVAELARADGYPVPAVARPQAHAIA
ncbi:MAG: CBS domain-containing protein [Deltaproteobacteria bacterium]